MNTLTNLNNFPIGNSLDGVNIVTEEINTLSLLVDGTNNMLADLNMDNHSIKNLDSGVDAGDAVNKSQLDLKADTLYVNNQLALKADKTYVDSSLNLLRSYVVNNFVDLSTGQLIGGNKTFSNQVTFNGATKTNLVATDIPNAGTRTWLDSNGLQTISGTKIFANSVSFNGPSVTLTNGATCNNKNLTNVLNPVNAQDASTKNYVDSSLNLLRTYVDTQDTALRTYTDSSLNSLRDYVNTQDTALRTYTDSSLNLLRDYVNTQDAAARVYVDSSLNLKVNKNGDTMTDVLTINKNASLISYFTYVANQSNTLNLTTGNVIYDGYTVNQNVLVYVPYINGGDTSLVNKAVYFNTSSTTQIWAGGSGSYYINGTLYVTTTTFSIIGPFRLKGLSTIGYYTVESSSGVTSIEQLTLKSNYGLNANSEFSGINFNNNNTDVGYIRVESNRLNNNNSTMRFYNRVSNNLVLPLEINSNINAYKPIIRNAWSSGELIQTKIYNQTTNGSGVQQINANSDGTSAYVDWKTIAFTTLNTPTDSILVVEVFAPYLYNGTLGDRLTSKIVDTTSSQTIVESGVAYINGAGGGARGLPFLPLVGSYTPTGATKARSIKISFDNDGDDILYICRILPRGSVVTDKNNYTIKVSEYKL